MLTTKNQKLLPSAFQNCPDQFGSLDSVRKLSKPTKWVTRSTVVKSDRPSVPNSGTIMIAV